MRARARSTSGAIWENTGTGDCGFGDCEVEGWALFTKKVPEPGTLALFGLGLAGLGIARRKRLI